MQMEPSLTHPENRNLDQHLPFLPCPGHHQVLLERHLPESRILLTACQPLEWLFSSIMFSPLKLVHSSTPTAETNPKF